MIVIGVSVASAVLCLATVFRFGSELLAGAVVDQALAPFVWMLGRIF